MRWFWLVGLLAGCDFHVDGVGLPGVGGGGSEPPSQSQSQSPEAPDLSDPSPITPTAMPDLGAPADASTAPALIDIGNACGPPKSGCSPGESCLT